jgi:hypothetical protein
MFNKWIDQALKEIMDVVDRGTHSLKIASPFKNSPFTSLFDHLNGKIRSKRMGLTNVFIKEEDVVVAWILIMQECELSITL